MTQGTRPDGQIFASQAVSGELEDFPAETRGWGVTVDGNDEAGNKVTDPTDGIPPMEWMNGILNKLSAQIFWNMRHAIPAWATGAWDAGAFVTYSGWVYYNASTAETSETPGSGSAWVKLFPLTGMDGRYLEISKNLEEIAVEGATAQQAARDNLGLKSAATHDVTASADDTTPGHVLQVGDWGLGGSPRQVTVDDESRGSFWRDTTAGKSGVTMPFDGTPTTNFIAVDGANLNAYVGRKKGSDPITWAKLYSEFNKPTATDVDAVSAKNGGTFQKPIAVKGNGAAISLWSLAADQATYILGKDFDGTNLWYVGRGGAANDVTLSNYIGLNNLTLHEDGSISLAAGHGKNVNVTGEIIPSLYGNFDARYISNLQLGAQVSVARNDDTGENKAAAGYVVTGSYSSYQDSNWEMDNLLCKPVQKYINGAWVTIGG
ncbi:MAG TPA: hypothetical protein VGN40_21320 [Lelliottia sp.]|jgi:hypothetical protein